MPPTNTYNTQLCTQAHAYIYVCAQTHDLFFKRNVKRLGTYEPAVKVFNTLAFSV